MQMIIIYIKIFSFLNMSIKIMTKMRFLCTNHVNWLRAHPGEILPAWNNATEQAIYYQDRNIWTQAIAPLGCSYELAALLLELQSSPESKWFKKLQAKEEMTEFDIKENTEQAFLFFSESTKRFIFALIKAERDDLASKTIDQVRNFFRLLEKQQERINPRQMSELIRTLRVIRYAGVDDQMQTKLLVNRLIKPQLTLQ